MASTFMDLLFSIQPVPGLRALWWAVRSLHLAIRNSKHCQEQLKSIADSAAELLLTLHKATEKNSQDSYMAGITEELQDFEDLLMEITVWTSRESEKHCLKAMYTCGDRVAALDQYHRRLVLMVERFKVGNLISLSKLQQSFEAARQKDQEDEFATHTAHDIPEEPTVLPHLLKSPSPFPSPSRLTQVRVTVKSGRKLSARVGNLFKARPGIASTTNVNYTKTKKIPHRVDISVPITEENVIEQLRASLEGFTPFERSPVAEHLLNTRF
ncbi:hypothetical protein DL96DRAFT_1829158 [Flagelloscypha sp. PMI_526]|nr:hypothetical protein DL96DRAFT_1829158 [Flagelloscypha sp. PMI_526]